MAASPKNQFSDSTGNGAVINSIEFARKALEIRDTIAVCRFSRLGDVLASSEGVLNYRLVGGSSQDGRLKLQLFVQGNLRLRCQRCLEVFQFELDIAPSFFIVSNESAIPSPEEETDEEYLVAEAEMQVTNLIEDEILLSLPLSPRHELGHCGIDGKLNELKPSSPFAALQGLKIGKSRN